MVIFYSWCRSNTNRDLNITHLDVLQVIHQIPSSFWGFLPLNLPFPSIPQLRTSLSIGRLGGQVVLYRIHNIQNSEKREKSKPPSCHFGPTLDFFIFIKHSSIARKGPYPFCKSIRLCVWFKAMSWKHVKTSVCSRSGAFCLPSLDSGVQ